MSEATTMQATLQRTDGTVRVPFEHLHDSPTQPRTFYDEAYIRELADSIKANGDILQPIMVRKRMPNVLRTEWDPADGFELIFGHCRKRGGMLAGLDSAPIQCVEMTDKQVQIAQLTENVKRKELHFIDAAEGVTRLRRQFEVHVFDLMAQTGMSKTYIYDQMKLADACDSVKKACRADTIDMQTALLIARIPAHKLQEKALADALEIGRAENGQGYRKTRRTLLDKYSLYLKDALWSLDDALLVPSAGACTACPSRSGASPETYGDVLDRANDYYSTPKHGKDVCMNPECFATKKKTQLELDARELAGQGKVVVTGNAAKQALTAAGDVKGAYVAVTEVKALLKNVKGAERPKTVLIQDQRSGKTVEAIKKSDLAGAGVAVPESPVNAHEARSRREREEEAKWNKKAAHENEARLSLLAEVRAAMLTKPRTTFDLRMVAAKMIGGIHGESADVLYKLYGVEDSDDLKKKIETMSPDQAGMLMMDRLLVDGLVTRGYELRNGYGAGKAGHLHTLATHHGVDVKAHRAAFDASKGLPTPPPAAQARGAGARKATKGQPVAKPEPKYRKAATGETWSGKGMMPAWFKAAMAQGKRPADFETAPAANPAGAGLADTQTLSLELEDSIQPAAPESLTKTAEAVDQARLQPAWPFPKPGPLAPEVSDDAGIAGRTGATAAAVASTEVEAQ